MGHRPHGGGLSRSDGASWSWVVGKEVLEGGFGGWSPCEERVGLGKRNVLALGLEPCMPCRNLPSWEVKRVQKEGEWGGQGGPEGSWEIQMLSHSAGNPGPTTRPPCSSGRGRARGTERPARDSDPLGTASPASSLPWWGLRGPRPLGTPPTYSVK